MAVVLKLISKPLLAQVQARERRGTLEGVIPT